MTDSPQNPSAPLDDLGFAELPREYKPPPELEGHIVEQLRVRGLIAEKKAASKGALALAASLLLAIGFVAGHFADAGTGKSPRDLELEYMLVLHGDEGDLDTDLETAELVDLYRSWARDLAAEDRFVAGERFESKGRWLGSAAFRIPRNEPGEAFQISGYFRIRAADWGEASRIARTCPHFSLGGVIELRQIAEG